MSLIEVSNFKVGKSAYCLCKQLLLTVSWTSEGRHRNISQLEKCKFRYWIFRPWKEYGCICPYCLVFDLNFQFGIQPFLNWDFLCWLHDKGKIHFGWLQFYTHTHTYAHQGHSSLWKRKGRFSFQRPFFHLSWTNILGSTK